MVVDPISVGLAVGAFGGSLGGSMLQAGMSRSANKDMLNRQMAFNAQQAYLNRSFQERMIRNAHQYEVQDLRKANLNPILSANGGASGASGASASVSGNGSINMDNPFTSWVNSQTALSQMKQAQEQVKSLQKGQQLTDEQIKQQEIINKFLPEQLRSGIANVNANTNNVETSTEGNATIQKELQDSLKSWKERNPGWARFSENVHHFLNPYGNQGRNNIEPLKGAVSFTVKKGR